MTRIASIIYAIGAGFVVMFQIGLAIGMPWGEFAMGGMGGDIFSPAMRISALVQAALLMLLAWITLRQAGVVSGGPAFGKTWLIWLVVALSAVTMVLNAISPSDGEKAFWLPLTIIMFASSLIVAIASRKSK